MKKLLCMIVVAAFAMMALSVSAQDRPTAVLQHGNSPKVFYGPDAFVSAFAEAQAGDLISLSLGNFNVPAKIDKTLKIQGSGHNTVLNAALTVEGTDAIDGFWLEGVCGGNLNLKGTMNNTTIQRCRFTGTVSVDAAGENCLFIQSLVYKMSYPGNMAGLDINNCIIAGHLWFGNAVMNLPSVHNCYIEALKADTYKEYARGSYTNCIIKTFSQCNKSLLIFSNVICTTTANEEMNLENYTKLSSTEFEALFAEKELRTLTEAAASQYIGSDGTQIGAYGGQTPFTKIPAIPQITMSNFGTATNADGKLPVTIKVEVNN